MPVLEGKDRKNHDVILWLDHEGHLSHRSGNDVAIVTFCWITGTHAVGSLIASYQPRLSRN